MVIPPYGGRLVRRLLDPDAAADRLEDASELQTVEMNTREALDTENIGTGAYSPLEGFMAQEEYSNVLHREELSNEIPWTIPVTLCPDESQSETVKGLKEGEEVALTYHGRIVAVLCLQEKFTYSKRDLAKYVYETTSLQHPDVKRIGRMGDTMLGGGIEVLRRVSATQSETQLTPRQTREIFSERRWSTIAAYQTRNPPHMAHEYIQRCALEMVDGLLIHPVIGELKEDDFPVSAIISAYQLLVDRYYPAENVLLATLPISMRYAGPRAAVFLAIIRRNYGCTHFICGRDVAGVNSFYRPYEAHRKLLSLDLGIKPILFEESFYCKQCGGMASKRTCGHYVEHHMKISMTAIRKLLSRGELPAKEVMRPEVAKLLLEYVPATPGQVQP